MATGTYGVHLLGLTALRLHPMLFKPITDGQDFYVAIILSANAAGLDYATFFGELLIRVVH
jgi:hypothetical protein